MFAVLATATVKLVGVPAAICPVGGVTLMPVRGLSVTVAVAVLPAALAVTVASWDVVNVVAAVPLESVMTVPGLTVPLVVVNVTGTAASPTPLTSSTRADTVLGPPEHGSACGLAVNNMWSAPAEPTFRFSILPEAPPEKAVIVAVPLCPFAKNVTRAWPLFVRASAGSIRPIVVVKVTTVPLCTGVPAPGDEDEVGVVGVVGVPGVVGVLGAVVDPCSMTVATISIDPFDGTVVAVANSVMTLPVGARSGTLSQDVEKTVAERQASAVRTLPTPRALRRAVCASIGKPKHNSLMGLQRQYGEHGYAMAALLVSIAVMSVLMTAALPAWRQQAKREKEAELVFRGEQYVRAIRLWEMKMGPGTRPPSFDILVQQKFLRKKYKDPMTEDGEFQPLFAGVNLPQQPGGPQPGGPQPGRGVGVGVGGRGIQPQPMPPQAGRSGIPTQIGGGGILGVVSKSKEASIRIYKGGTHYNEWNFIYANASTAPGGRGAPMPGGRGGSPFPGGRGPDGRGMQPGGRGFGPGMGPGRGFPQGPTITPTSPSGRGGR